MRYGLYVQYFLCIRQMFTYCKVHIGKFTGLTGIHAVWAICAIFLCIRQMFMYCKVRIGKYIWMHFLFRIPSAPFCVRFKEFPFIRRNFILVSSLYMNMWLDHFPDKGRFPLNSGCVPDRFFSFFAAGCSDPVPVTTRAPSLSPPRYTRVLQMVAERGGGGTRADQTT
jgi:hypothetical protein